MATPPDFTAGQVLTAAQMNAVGLWKMNPTSVSSGSSIIGNGTVEFTSAATISLNGIFTDDFRNYVININQTAVSGSGFYRFRFRASGSDNTSSTYNFYIARRSSLDGGIVQSFNRTQNIADIGNSNVGANQATTLRIFSPKLAEPTHGLTEYVDSAANYGAGAFMFTGSTAFDGCSIIFTGTNITGELTVYGYN
jgi:hypothetical protein